MRYNLPASASTHVGLLLIFSTVNFLNFLVTGNKVELKQRFNFFSYLNTGLDFLVRTISQSPGTRESLMKCFFFRNSGVPWPTLPTPSVRHCYEKRM
jgi:hypothetical protein